MATFSGPSALPVVRLGPGATFAERLILAIPKGKSGKPVRGSLAALATAMGISRPHLSHMLKGQRPCPLEAARNAAKHLKVPARWLVEGDDRFTPTRIAGDLISTGLRIADFVKFIGDEVRKWLALLNNEAVTVNAQIPFEWEESLIQFGVPCQEVSAEEWLRAFAWISKHDEVGGSLQQWAVLTEEKDDSVHMRRSDGMRHAWFRERYNDLVRRLGDPVTVTMSGCAWLFVQAGVEQGVSEPLHMAGTFDYLENRHRSLFNDLTKIPRLHWNHFVRVDRRANARARLIRLNSEESKA